MSFSNSVEKTESENLAGQTPIVLSAATAFNRSIKELTPNDLKRAELREKLHEELNEIRESNKDGTAIVFPGGVAYQL